MTAAGLLTACGSLEDEEGEGSDGGSSADQAEEWEAPEGLDGELTYYSANPQGLTDELVEAFEEKTDVSVNVFSGETGKITAKLEAEQGNPQADLVYLASWSAAQSQSSAGGYEEFTPEVDGELRDGWASETGDFTGRDGSALALVTNTEALGDAEAPADWEDLTDEAYKDKVIMPDPRESGTAADLIAAMVDKWGEDKTWELFDALFDNGMEVQGANGPALDAVTSGSKAVVFGGVDYSAYSAIDKGEPLEVVVPSSGTTITPRPVLVSDQSDNVEAAEAFANFMFSPEGQAISADNYMIPSVGDVPANGGTEYDDTEQLTTDLDGLAEESDGVTDDFVSRYL
ncbi:MAG TPA: extracellular solute-binding protein [Candidatus Corynebacterium avicola]|uniref:Extracellular solute-binding protein n=1 Tax=Candidatus Corynebacterium avicola TaxID=2838527 RepID=A0A9D1ULA7_9CORY|nr:extracellular solute-binding protein [Candidatus Corynebacterium avicola]